MPNHCYALLVGIDDYAHFNRLDGCVRDVWAVKKFLETFLQPTDLRLDVRVLLDAQATKSALVHQVRHHLGQAGEGDVALFYYAGHGAKEVAAPVFAPFEFDGELEVLVCQDSHPHRAGTDLSDKELRYLIHELAAKGGHVVSLFDCCFAGSNTRNLDEGSQQAKVRRVEMKRPQRAWGDFLFAREIPEGLLRQGRDLGELLPHGLHVHLAACRRDEEANEHPQLQRGIFTLELLNLLEQGGGKLSYHDLIVRLRLRVANTLHQLRVQGVPMVEQHPVLYTYGDVLDLRFLTSFQGVFNQQRLKATIGFDLELQQWKMNLGALHGIPQPGLQPTFVEVGEQADAEGAPAPARLKAQVTAVSPAHSLLRFVEGHPPRQDQLLVGTVPQGSHRSLELWLSGEEAGVAPLRTQLSSLPGIQWASAPEQADYRLEARENAFHWHVPDHDRPILRPIPGYESQSRREVERYLHHMAIWEHLRQLTNPHSRLQPRVPVELQVYRTGPGGQQARQVFPQNGTIRWKHTRVQGEPRIFFKVKLINHNRQPLFCSLIYLSQTFQVFPHLLEDSVLEVPPGEQQAVFAKGGSPLEFRLPDYIQQDSWPWVTDYLKLVVCTEPFDIDLFRLPSLPAPGTAGTTDLRAGDQARGSLRFVEHDWASQLLLIQSLPPD